MSPGNAYFEVGADAGQMFDKAQHSTVLIVLRCSGLPYTMKGLCRFCKPTILITGPREATNLQPFLQDLVGFLKEHMYGATPLSVKGCEFQGEWQNGATRFLGYSKKHKFALATINDGSGEQHFAWDEALTLTDQQHCDRASMAALNKRQPQSDQVRQRCVGCHGFSIFRLMLPYVDSPNLFCAAPVACLVVRLGEELFRNYS